MAWSILLQGLASVMREPQNPWWGRCPRPGTDPPPRPVPATYALKTKQPPCRPPRRHAWACQACRHVLDLHSFSGGLEGERLLGAGRPGHKSQRPSTPISGGALRGYPHITPTYGAGIGAAAERCVPRHRRLGCEASCRRDMRKTSVIGARISSPEWGWMIRYDRACIRNRGHR
jgi:hypothetical protein